ncbi:MAG: PAS domain-containing protein [Lentisphaerota bacterium]
MQLYIDKLKAARKRKKTTSEELAKKVGVTRSTLSLWENAKIIPSEFKIRTLAKALDISVNEISDLIPEKMLEETNLAPFRSTFKSLLGENKEKDLNEIHDLCSKIMRINKKLSDAKLIIRAMISSLPIILYIKGPDLKYLTANEAFLKNLSLDRDYSLVGKSDSDLFPVNEAKINTEMDKKVFSTGESILNKESLIPGNRKSRWGIISKIPILDSENRIEGLLGCFTDITERKLAEEELQSSMDKIEEQNIEIKTAHAELAILRERYFDLFNLSPVGHLLLNKEGAIIESNLIACSLLSLPRNLLLQQPLHRFIAQEDKDIFNLAYQQLLKNGIHQNLKVSLLKKDGTTFSSEIILNSTQDAKGIKTVMATVII